MSAEENMEVTGDEKNPEKAQTTPSEGEVTEEKRMKKGKAKKLDQLAAKKWKEDAEKAGLGGFEIQDAVAAVMYNAASATLPDPLSRDDGVIHEDPDDWLAHAEDAGLIVDEEDLEIMGVEEGDGSGLMVVKEEPVIINNISKLK